MTCISVYRDADTKSFYIGQDKNVICYGGELVLETDFKKIIKKPGYVLGFSGDVNILQTIEDLLDVKERNEIKDVKKFSLWLKTALMENSCTTNDNEEGSITSNFSSVLLVKGCPHIFKLVGGFSIISVGLPYFAIGGAFQYTLSALKVLHENRKKLNYSPKRIIEESISSTSFFSPMISKSCVVHKFMY